MLATTGQIRKTFGLLDMTRCHLPPATYDPSRSQSEPEPKATTAAQEASAAITAAASLVALATVSQVCSLAVMVAVEA